MFTVKIIVTVIFILLVCSPLIVAMCFLIYESIVEANEKNKKDRILELLEIPKDVTEQKIWFNILERKLFCDLENGDIFIPINEIKDEYDIKEHIYMKQGDNFINLIGTYNIKKSTPESIIRIIYTSEKTKKIIYKLTRTEITIKI